MLRVGQKPPNGRQLTRFDSNPNQFNTLNSHFGCNSVLKNCYEYRNIGFNDVSEECRQTIHGYKSGAILPVIDRNRFSSIWSEWPTLEESFGGELKTKRAQPLQWPQTIPTAQPILPTSSLQLLSASEVLPQSVSQWTTGFWNNINKLTEIDGIHSTDINNNAMNWRYKTETMVSSNGYGFNNKWHSVYGRAQPPVGTRLRKQHKNGGCPSTEESFKNNTSLSEESLMNLSNMTKSLYIQPKIRRRQPSLMECVFCRNNNERPEFYRSHILKDPESNIQCPVLRAYDCPICHNGGGPKAHTIRYCPLNKAGFQSKLEQILKSQSMESLIPDWTYLKKRRNIQKKGN